tara:strand:+ start:3728 stop:4402 length:675 start_codon:yes stop_codon:yes gene_type:complete
MKNKVDRFERKWVFRSGNYLALINSLLRSDLFFSNQYPPRKVNSIYFDDFNFSSVRENLDGVSNKKKIRIRWYGKKNQLTKPQLEIKSKKGSETSKRNYVINELNGLNFYETKNLDKIRDLVNYKTKSKRKLSPLLSTHYERQYFISNNNKIRATVDYNLQSIYLNNLSQLNIIKNFNKACILELKYPTKLDKFVRQKLKNITLRLTKNSKFVNSAFETPRFFS